MVQSSGNSNRQHLVARAVASTDEIRFWLEWGGGKMLALTTRHTGPTPPRAQWPDYPRDPAEAYGYGKTLGRLKLPPPTSDEIPIMDEILTFPSVIEDVTRRRIVQCRSLVYPLNGRHLFPWTRIGRLLHISRATAAEYHRRGLLEIATGIPAPKASLVRAFMAESLFSS